MADPGLYHEYESEVADSEVEGIIKPQAHWNAKHKPVKLLGYELIEEKDEEDLPPGTTTCTFSGLNGDDDEEYFIEGRLTYAYATNEGYLTVTPNGISVSQYYSRIYWGHNTNGHNAGTSICLCSNGAENSFVTFKATLHAKTGSRRDFESLFNCIHTSDESRYGCQVTGHWNNTSTNITSLVISTNYGSFTGTIRLWKKLPLNLED